MAFRSRQRTRQIEEERNGTAASVAAEEEKKSWLRRRRRRRKRHEKENGHLENGNRKGEQEQGMEIMFRDSGVDEEDYAVPEGHAIGDEGYWSAPETNESKQTSMSFGDYERNEASTNGEGIAAVVNRTVARVYPARYNLMLIKRKRMMRKMVTGDEERRVRDFVKDWVKMPKVLRTRDKARALWTSVKK